jgi:hypothetical protein
VIVATGELIRVANIDAPETHSCRCARECRLGAAAFQARKDIAVFRDVAGDLRKRHFAQHTIGGSRRYQFGLYGHVP